MKYTYNELATFYYDHKYTHFDHLCETIDDRLECIDMYIEKGYSTPDFEIQKYIIADDSVCIHYILTKYKLDDWENTIITSIICQSSPIILIHIISAYENNTKNKLTALKWFDEILYVSITSNIEMFCLICKACDLEDKWISVLSMCNSEEQVHNQVKSMFTWGIRDVSNSRNLMYALKIEDIESALYLIDNGVQVDIWNNYCMKLIISTPILKQHPTLFKKMLASGAKIPKHILNEAKKQVSKVSIMCERLGIHKENLYEM